MDARIGNQVGLELVEVDIESSVEPERGGDRGHDLGDESVEVGVGRSLDVQILSTNVVDCLTMIFSC